MDMNGREWRVFTHPLPKRDYIYGYSLEFDDNDPEYGIDLDHLNEYRPGDPEVIGGMIKIRRDGGYSFCDRYGAPAMAGSFEYAGQFDQGLCIVGNRGRYGIIDTAGNIVVPLEHDSIYWLYDTPHLGFVLPDRYLLDVPKLEVDAPHYAYGHGRQRYLMEVANWDLYMPWHTFDKVLLHHGGMDIILDVEGNLRTPLRYSTIQHNGLAKAGRKWALLDSEGAEVLPPVYDSLRKITPEPAVTADGFGDFVIACMAAQRDRAYTNNGLFLCELPTPVYTAKSAAEQIIQACGCEQLDDNHYLTWAQGKYGVIQARGTAGYEYSGKQLCGFCEVVPFTFDDPEACKRAYLLRMVQAYRRPKMSAVEDAADHNPPRQLMEAYETIVCSQGINNEEYRGFTARKGERWFFIEMKLCP